MKRLLSVLLLASNISFANVLVYSQPCEGSCYAPEDGLSGTTPLTYAASLMNSDLEQQKRLNQDRYWLVISQKCSVQEHTFGKDIAVCTAVTR